MSIDNIIIMIFIFSMIIIFTTSVYAADTITYCDKHILNNNTTSYLWSNEFKECMTSKGLAFLEPRPYSSLFHGEP